MGRHIVVKTGLTLNREKRDIFANFRYWSALFDWDLLSTIDKRRVHLISLCKNNDKHNIAKMLEYSSESIVCPNELDGFDSLSDMDKMFVHIIFIHSEIPNKEILMEDMTLIVGVGKDRAYKYISDGIMIPDGKFISNPPLLFCPNKNHVACFLDKIREVSDVEIFIAGGFGRGKNVGHDIDIMVDEKDVKDTLSLFNTLDATAINSNSFVVMLLDTLVRVDVASFNKDNMIPAFMHYLGPAQLNIWMRKRAIQRGYVLSQHGLRKNGNIVNIKSEQELNNLIGVSEGTREKWWSRY